jgi:uncharacterized protein involved in exopolysaccharide biosynthesis
MIIELTRANFAYILFRKRRLIGIAAAGVMTLAVLYCILATPQYQSKSALVVSFSPMPSGVPGDGAQASAQAVAPVDHEEIINSYTLELRSADLAREVIKEIGVERLYPPHPGLNPFSYLLSALDGAGESAAAASLSQQRTLEAAVERFLKSDLDVQSERNSNVITVTLLNGDRALAVDAVRRLIDRFIEREGRFDRDPRLEFIRGQVEVYRKHVTDAQAAMEAFQIKNGISSMEEERTAMIQQRANLEQSIVAVHSRAVGDGKSYQTLRAAIRQLSPVVATAQDDKDPLELTARTNLADLEAREAILRQTFSDSSQAVQDIHKRIQAAETLLAHARSRTPLTHSEPNVAYQQMQVAMFQTKADLDAAQESEASQRQQLERLNKRLAARNRQEGGYQDAVRDYQLADQNYRLYLQGVESARIADDLNKQRITSISVFDGAYASTRPARPKRLLALVMGALGGLLLGFGLAFVAEATDEALSTPAQVAAVLKLPVVGSMERVL